MADVFISYSKLNRDSALKLASELQGLGYNVWWDTSLVPQGNYRNEIDQQLDAAGAVIVIWSPESIKSKWVQSEADHADGQAKLVNTFTIGLENPGKEIPKPFNQIHAVMTDDLPAITQAIDHLQVNCSKGDNLSNLVYHSQSLDIDQLTPEQAYLMVKDSKDKALLETFLQKFKNSEYALAVNVKIEGIKRLETEQAELEKQSAREEAATYVWEQLKASNDKEKLREFFKTYRGTVAYQKAVESLERGRGNVFISAPFTQGIENWFFTPGAGKIEWFSDFLGSPEMVIVPEGSFMMGAPSGEERLDRFTNDEELNKYIKREEPLHKVDIASPFAVSRFAITFNEWEVYVKSSKCEIYQPADNGWGKGDRPVINVSWHDAQGYIKWLNSRVNDGLYRLLSEAEWEYVARAKTKTMYWWGDGITSELANYDRLYGERSVGEGLGTCPVKNFESNPWGLFQVHGNVWEWCEDTWHPNYFGAPKDGTAWTDGGVLSKKIIRGGTHISPRLKLRSANRGGISSDYRSCYNGFRVAKTLII